MKKSRGTKIYRDIRAKNKRVIQEAKLNEWAGNDDADDDDDRAL